MPVTERRVDRGSRLAVDLHRKLAVELRDLRVAAGLSQRTLATAAGTTHASISRIEACQAPATTLRTYATLFSLLGHGLSVKVYPEGSPPRDRLRLGVLDRFRACLHPSIGTQTEVPVGPPGDLRAWDMVLSTIEGRCMVDAESVLSDLQALERRLAVKARDSNADRVLLVVAATDRNRRILREHGHVLRTRFPMDMRVARCRLREGRLPEASAIVLA